MLNEIVGRASALLGGIPFQTLVIVVAASFLGLSLIMLVLSIFVAAFKSASKRPYLSFVNAYTAVFLATMLMEFAFNEACILAVGFWFVGFLLYGLLCLITPKAKMRTYLPAPVQINNVQETSGNMLSPTPNVRLEHAIAVSDKLLVKPLSKGDRMEVERINLTLKSLKGSERFTLEDGKILNDGFNALIKLMAKYNL